MHKLFPAALFVWLAVSPLPAARKPHVVAFGKWQTVKWFADATSPQLAGAASEDSQPIDAQGVNQGVNLKIRAIYVDGQLKENSTGAPHDITDRVFVVRRAYRVNDSLPGEDAKAPRWRWQLGGWLQVDRVSGRVSALNLPEFDPYYSSATWYRDYVGYCGVSDDGRKLHAVVALLGRRKPLVKASMGEPDEQAREAKCNAPTWQRNPTLVTFEVGGGSKTSFQVRGHSADLITEDSEEETPSR